MIACIEEPLLIAKILGHVQQREALNDPLARAPPGRQRRICGQKQTPRYLSECLKRWLIIPMHLYVDSYEVVVATAENTINELGLEVLLSDQDKGEIVAALPRDRITLKDANFIIPGVVQSDVIVINVVDLSSDVRVDMKIIYYSGQQDWSEYIPRFFDKLNTQLSRN